MTLACIWRPDGRVRLDRTWVVLFLAIANLAEALAPMREGGMIYMLPMMAFPVCLGLSGVARFWMGRHPTRRVTRSR